MKFLHPIASLFLAAIMLITSIGVTINFHLCGGKVQSSALFVKAQPCKDVQKPCHGTEHHSEKNGCCEEKSVALKGGEATALVKAPTHISPSFNLIAVILPVLYSIVDLESSVSTPRYAHYKPPLIEKDITVLVHTFLI
ncbi:MAG TPA: hypothetical protein PLR06_14215 [Cyclobacteriaceae bacterium]|nr:hypothetical protein [Cyclobacteriaceae bacterium]